MAGLLVLCLIFLFVIDKAKLTFHGCGIFVIFRRFRWGSVWVVNLCAAVLGGHRESDHLLVILKCEIVVVHL